MLHMVLGAVGFCFGAQGSFLSRWGCPRVEVPIMKDIEDLFSYVNSNEGDVSVSLKIAPLLHQFVGELDQYNSDGKTLLMCAAQQSMWGVMNALLQYGANQGLRSKDGKTLEDFMDTNLKTDMCRRTLKQYKTKAVVQKVTCEGDVCWLEDSVSEPSFFQKSDYTLLSALQLDIKRITPFDCFKENDQSSLAAYQELKIPLDLDTRDQDGNTPLLKAVDLGFDQTVGHLLKLGANPNDTCLKEARTALMIACSKGDKASVKQLLMYGADKGLRSNKDYTAYTYLSMAMNNEIISYPMFKAIDQLFLCDQLSLFSMLSDTKQDEACVLEACKELSGLGLDWDIQDNEGKTLLMLAVERGFGSVVELLLNKDIDLSLTCDNGLDVFKYAARVEK